MKFYIYTLGCKVNSYESEVMSDALINAGYEIGSIDSSDIYIINTCTVTNTADQKSMKMIRQAIRNNQEAIIVVAGCMSQRNKEQAENINGVDIVIGNVGKSNIVKLIEEFKETKKKKCEVKSLENVSFETMKINNFHHTRAFVKIEDGCNNFCSYCIIPYTRGDVRSKPKEEVLEEITTLIKNGHKEIVLTGIHTGHYGADLTTYDFADLLEEIILLQGLERLRISSIEITEINDKVLTVLKKSSILVDHMHIPLQSGCNQTLKEMNRKYDTSYFKNKIKEIRAIRPSIAITTDVIVGFPGETEENFKETIETIEAIKFSHIHVFPYSKRDGTVSALMQEEVEEPIKKERVHRLLEISKKLEIEYMNQFLNKQVEFIPEVWKNGFLIGHTGNYLLVKVPGEKEELHKTILATLDKIEFPYALGKLTDNTK